MNIKKLLILFFFLGSIVSAQLSHAQSVSTQDLSTIQVDNLTDAQIMRYMQQAQASGMTQDQLAQLAAARGMKPQEVQKLQARIAAIQNKTQTVKPTTTPAVTGTAAPRTVDFGTTAPAPVTDTTKTASDALLELKPKIFGQDLFNNSGTTFEPNLRLATPLNYVIGTGDQLLIDISGYSEASYQLTVTPEGTITIPFAGVIPVAGLTIDGATKKIKSKLSTAYSGLNNGTVKLNIALGNIRSIKVIVNGEVTRPGTYTLPSLASVFNALYSSGGPTDNGSFRNIEIIRSGKKIATLDVYDFLVNGDLKNNITLHDQDIINVPPYQKRVEMIGEVKRPAIYEVKGNESLATLLKYAGDFTENAYKARIKVLKNTPTERKVNDVTSDQFATYIPQSGDKYYVDVILDRYENRVTIDGAVYRPGQYELEPGLTLKALIKKANGLKEDAFKSRGYITRLTSDLNTELVSFDVGKIVSGQAADIPLQREDYINISSIFDLKEQYKVQINGQVRTPGEFSYSENMSLEELIIKAGGFQESATPQRIEIARRVRNADANSTSSQIADVFTRDVNKDLSKTDAGFILQPFDIVSVRSAPGYETQKIISVTGEVLYSGNYTIIKKNERISDVIKRAGGLTALAFPEGASLKRAGGDTGSKLAKEIEQQKLDALLKLQKDANDTLSAAVVKETLQNDFVGIDLPSILAKPGGIDDIFLEDGDILFVPKQLQTVRVSGEVLSPVTVVFESGKSFREYIDNGGGFSEKALKKRAYIVYANGKVKSTHKFLFWNVYPSVKQGAEIFVPTKQDTQGLTAQQWVSIGTGLTTIAAVIVAILKK
ncbi:capsule biosynthesis protein [Inquilinus sp. KBS0705]|nr:capsule biosynthesis protein [Inquilinus sp. KBS0705]